MPGFMFVSIIMNMQCAYHFILQKFTDLCKNNETYVMVTVQSTTFHYNDISLPEKKL
jgi:hypothetical protein